MNRLMMLFFMSMLLVACSNSSDDNNGSGNGNGNAQDPANGVQLVFPFENSLCNEGLDLTPTTSTVLFEWEPNDNAEVYALTIENLSTNGITQVDSEDFIVPVTINRAAPYRWFVSYNLNGETKQSEVWNFYNAGPGIHNYSPFPAEIIFPMMAQTVPATNSLVLQWIGSDLDDDIINYDVYFGTENPPALSTEGLVENQFEVTVQSGSIYYWYIISNDAAGNSSESGIQQFRVAE